MQDNRFVLSGFRGPHCTYVLPTDQTNVISIIRRAQALCAITEKKTLFAKSVVREKLEGMRKTLHFTGWNAASLREEIKKALRVLPSVEQIDALMGMEGAITRKMYLEMQKRLPQELGFRGRNRRPPLDPVNAWISYCNTIIYAFCVPPLAKSGLNTAIGFLHEPGMGRHSLALDMAEGLKPLLSEWTVIHRAQRGEFLPDMEETTAAGCFLSKTGRKAARESMKQAMLRLFGPDSTEHLGWPGSLWKALEYYANTMTKSVLRGTPCQRWHFI